MLPKIAAEVSAPIAQTNKITMVSDGTGPVGAANVTREVSPSRPINQLGSRGLLKPQVGNTKIVILF